MLVRPGERWAVVGPNGAGKSSLLAAVAGVLPIAAGTVRLDGRRLAPQPQWVPAALAARRAWCPQFWSDPFASSVRETAALALADPEAHDQAVTDVLHALDLASLAQADVRTLSGGERQRVAIATTVLQGAPLWLLDEPASHLDLLHQQGLLALVRRHAQAGGSVLATLHDLNLAWDFATHAVLLDGRGGACSGERAAVLTPQRLSEVFGVPVHRVEVCGHWRYWIGPADGAAA
jgi:iron complex transport system ATP-binding protein